MDPGPAWRHPTVHWMMIGTWYWKTVITESEVDSMNRSTKPRITQDWARKSLDIGDYCCWVALQTVQNQHFPDVNGFGQAIECFAKRGRHLYDGGHPKLLRSEVPREFCGMADRWSKGHREPFGTIFQVPQDGCFAEGGILRSLLSSRDVTINCILKTVAMPGHWTQCIIFGIDDCPCDRSDLGKPPQATKVKIQSCAWLCAKPAGPCHFSESARVKWSDGQTAWFVAKNKG